MNTLFSLLFILISENYTTEMEDPRSLIDDARQQLDELESLVSGNILAAHSDLHSAESNFRRNNQNVLTAGNFAIQQMQQMVNSQLNAIKDLVENVDISSCTDNHEELLHSLPSEYREGMRSCISDRSAELVGLLSNAKYTVDVVINKVYNLKFQFNQCGESLLCISPLLTEIELDKHRLPESIKIEVIVFNDLVSTMRLMVQKCSETNVSGYVNHGLSIVEEIKECVDELLV